MKIALASDIHLEIGEQRLPRLPEGVDVLVLAGDIACDIYGAVWAVVEYGDFVGDIIYVAGNHEGYGYVLNDVHDRLRDYATTVPNFHFLEKDTVEIGGYAFIGGTCWTDYTVGNASSVPMNMIHARGGLKDHYRIQWREDDLGNLTPLSPDICQVENDATKAFIFSEIFKHGRDKSVVVTHHAPTPFSIADRFKGDALNCCYVNGWENDVYYGGPVVWMHGHVHDDFDYELGDTRIVCNPVGYPMELFKKEFEWKIIELP